MKPNELLEDLEELSTDKPGIYMIYCIPNGRAYIGQSKRIARRWVEHKRELRNNSHHCNHLQACYNKYGKDKFTFHVLKNSEDRLNELEQDYINMLDEEFIINIANVNKPMVAATLAKSKVPEELQQEAIQEYLRVAKQTKNNKVAMDETRTWLLTKGYDVSLTTIRRMTDSSPDKIYIAEINEEISLPENSNPIRQAKAICEILFNKFKEENDKGEKTNIDNMLKITTALYRYLDISIKIEMLEAKKSRHTVHAEEGGKILSVGSMEEVDLI